MEGLVAISESVVNSTENYRIYEDCYPVEGTVFEDMETSGEIFRWCVKEYGRCIGKSYIGDHKHVGWVFEKRAKYDDCNETYLQETWIALLSHNEHIHKVEYAGLNTRKGF